MRIALITDTHIARPAGPVHANLMAVRRWVARTAPAMTLHLGDVTAEGASHPEQLEAAATVFADWPGPLHVLPGNHDVGDNDHAARPHGQPAVDAARLDRHRRLFGPDRFHLRAGRWSLIGLDAQLLGSGGEEAEQDAWLDETLAAVEGPVALFLHKPLFLDGPNETALHQRYVPPEPRARLLARFAGRDLRLVACGHTHQFRRRMVEGVEHVWAPSCAFVVPDSMQPVMGEKVVGVLTLALDDDAHAVEFVTPDGVVCNDLLDQVDLYPQLVKGRP